VLRTPTPALVRRPHHAGEQRGRGPARRLGGGDFDLVHCGIGWWQLAALSCCGRRRQIRGRSYRVRGRPQPDWLWQSGQAARQTTNPKGLGSHYLPNGRTTIEINSKSSQDVHASCRSL
jgi:hypothetical protein